MSEVVVIKDRDSREVPPAIFSELKEKIGDCSIKEITLPTEMSILRRIELLIGMLCDDSEYILYIGKIPKIDIAFWDYVHSRGNGVNVMVPKFKLERSSLSLLEIQNLVEKIGREKVLIRTDGKKYNLMKFVGLCRVCPVVYYKKELL